MASQQKLPRMMKRSTEVEKRKPHLKRLQKLQTLITEKVLDGFLLCQPENIRYISGFTGSSGWLLISRQRAILATDFRYVEQAKAESPDFDIFQTKGEPQDWLPELVSELRWHKLGFEANSISYETYQRLSDTIRSKQIKLELVPLARIVEQFRSIKEPDEIECITKAAVLADTAFKQAKNIICAGMTEKEVAWEIEKILRQQGSEGVPFEIIVASGANSALPHARPTEKTILSGEPLLIDMGARINGYCSDFTRTLFLGKADKTFQEIYDIVLKAQTTALEGISSGMTAWQADRLARSIVEQAGYGDTFGHGLGHGVGLAIHELPTINPNSSDSLANGMVFTIEPGIYLAGQYGIRIEDLVILENDKVRVLTKADKAIYQLLDKR